MLKPSCRRFRDAFEPGQAPPHRRLCAACGAWAEVVETAAAAGCDRPLPAALGRRLAALGRPPLPGDGEQQALPGLLVQLPLPQLPLPPQLKARLRAIPRRLAAAPRWLPTSYTSVAASMLLAVVLGAAVGNPVTYAQPAAHKLSETAARTWDEAREQQASRLDACARSAATIYADARGQVRRLYRALATEWSWLTAENRSRPYERR